MSETHESSRQAAQRIIKELTTLLGKEVADKIVELVETKIWEHEDDYDHRNK